MEPTVYVPPPPEPPRGNALTRGLRAVLLEHRLPGRVQSVVDRAALKLGRKHKTVAADGLRLRIRRDKEDYLYVANVIEQSLYTERPGYELHSQDIVVDIGANIGTFALPAARAAREGRVIALEPVLENFQLLKENIRLNGLTNIEAIHAGVLDHSGVAPIWLDPSHSGYHSFQRWEKDPSAKGESSRDSAPASTCELAATLTLPELFESLKIERCHFLKLDCEGAEFPILYGLRDETLKRIDRIVMEYHTERMAIKRQESDALVRHLENHGFAIDAYLDYPGFRCGGIWARRSGD